MALQSHRARLLPYLLIAPAILLTVGISLYPALYAFYLSLHRSRRGVLEYVGTRNYQTLLTSGTYWHGVRLTATFGVMFVFSVLVLGYLLALAFNERPRHAALYMTIIFIPWMLSEIVVGVMWRWLFLPNVGAAQAWLTPLLGDNLLGNGTSALLIVTAAMVWRALAFGMLLLLAGLQKIPAALQEAAQIDGATPWQAFWRVTFPLMLPTTQITLVFLTVQALNAIGMFLAITDGGPGRTTEVLALHMYRETVQFLNFGYGAALSVTVFFINAVLALIYVRGLHTQDILS